MILSVVFFALATLQPYELGAEEGYRKSQQLYEIPDVQLVTMNDERVALRELLDADDSPILLNFIFTSCPGICPIMSATMSQFQGKLEPEELNDVRMFSVSIDPEYDSPARLRAYASNYHAGPQWQFLTGRLADVIMVQKAFDNYHGDKMSHAPMTLLRGSPQSGWVRIEGFPRAADLLAEYRQLDK